MVICKFVFLTILVYQHFRKANSFFRKGVKESQSFSYVLNEYIVQSVGAKRWGCLESFPGVVKIGNFTECNVLFANFNLATLHLCHSLCDQNTLYNKLSYRKFPIVYVNYKRFISLLITPSVAVIQHQHSIIKEKLNILMYSEKIKIQTKSFGYSKTQIIQRSLHCE